MHLLKLSSSERSLAVGVEGAGVHFLGLGQYGLDGWLAQVPDPMGVGGDGFASLNIQDIEIYELSTTISEGQCDALYARTNFGLFQLSCAEPNVWRMLPRCEGEEVEKCVPAGEVISLAAEGERVLLISAEGVWDFYEGAQLPYTEGLPLRRLFSFDKRLFGLSEDTLFLLEGAQ